MEPGGIEPPPNPYSEQHTAGSEGASATWRATTVSELAELLRSWWTLTPEVRSGILTIVRSSSSRGRSGGSLPQQASPLTIGERSVAHQGVGCEHGGGEGGRSTGRAQAGAAGSEGVREDPPAPAATEWGDT